jgi:hypothetical protein
MIQVEIIKTITIIKSNRDKEIEPDSSSSFSDFEISKVCPTRPI